MLEPLREQPGDLLATLTAYLDAESSLTETAAVLGVHRNTVTARIARAQELLAWSSPTPTSASRCTWPAAACCSTPDGPGHKGTKRPVPSLS
jgi:hypothetical protein